MAEILITARDIPESGFLKGYPVAAKESPAVWGSREALPDFVVLTVSDATAGQVIDYLENWPLKFSHSIINENAAGYRVRVETDSAYISASDVGRNEIKASMQQWAIDQGFIVQDFTVSSMTVDIPKPADLAAIKAEFADIYDSVLDIRRYCFAAGDVDQAVANGGEITFTKTQVLNRIIDKLAE